jgi:peptidoglycan biosynthesis protein MviN/MurJ (putative lipid II flippase)
VLASFLAVGALSGLRYAQMLYVLPVSLFAMTGEFDHGDTVQYG